MSAEVRYLPPAPKLRRIEGGNKWQSGEELQINRNAENIVWNIIMMFAVFVVEWLQLEAIFTTTERRFARGAGNR